MSYSFAVRGTNKTEAKAAVAAEFDKVEVAQRCHVQDRAQAQAAAFAFIDILPDDDTRDVRVSCNGSLSGTWVEGNDMTNITAANFGIYANLADRE